MKTPVVCALLLAVTADVASAAGLNLGWLDCAGLGAGAGNRTFACNTNSGGGHVLVGSFAAPAGLIAVNGFQALVYLRTQFSTLSPWWDIGDPPHCRSSNAVSFSANFTDGPFSCVDYWAGAGLGGGFYALPPNGGGDNWAELRIGFAIASGFGPINQGDEAYLFKATINNSKTVGPGSCTGCQDEACLEFRSALVSNDPASGEPDVLIANPAYRNWATWQGEIICCPCTPARRTSWGMIKSLYR